MRACHVFLDVDMRKFHAGLTDIASKRGVSLSNMKAGEIALFFNTRMNKAKAYGPNGVIAYARFDDGITQDALDEFPRFAGIKATLELSKSVKLKLLKILKEFGAEKIAA